MYKYDTLNVLQPWWLNYDQALDLQAPAQQVQYCLTLSLKLSRFEMLILPILLQQNTIKPPPPQHKVIKHEQVDQARWVRRDSKQNKPGKCSFVDVSFSGTASTR